MKQLTSNNTNNEEGGEMRNQVVSDFTSESGNKELKLVTYAFKAFFSLLWFSFKVIYLRSKLAVQRFKIRKLKRKCTKLLLQIEGHSISSSDAIMNKEAE